jgi:hypothetical protein
MVGVALVQPIIHGHGGVPVEWIAVGAWAILGLAVSTITVGNRRMKLARQS